MNGEKKYLLGMVGVFLFFLFALFSIGYQNVRSASVPAIINYQGRLLENGSAVTTTQSIGFMIYDAATGGNIVYTASGTTNATSSVSITPSSGLFSVNFGSGSTNSVSTTIFGDNTNLYLQVVIDNVALTPRKQLTAAPYAINSEYLLGISASSTHINKYIPFSDDFGNFTFSGTASSSSNAAGAIVYINPTSTDSNYPLFALATNDVPAFTVDSDGDAWLKGDFSVSSTASLIGGVHAPTYVSTIDIDGAGTENVEALHATGRFVYAANENDGMRVIDVRDPQNPVVVATIDGVADNLEDLFVSGRYAYAAFDEAGLYIYDITNPTIPVLAGSVDPGTVEGVYVSGNYAYLAMNTDGIAVVDISNPFSPTLVGSVDPGASGTADKIVVSGNYAYVADQDDLLRVYDVTDPRNPLSISRFLGGGGADVGMGVSIDDDVLYLSSQNAGLRIIDISNPVSTTLLSIIDPGGASISSHIAGDYAYVANNTEGMYIIDISSSTSPFLVGTNDQGDQYRVVSGNGTHIFFGDLTGNIQIYEIAGAKVSNAEIGSAKVSHLNVTGPSLFNADVSIRSGLTVGNNGLFLGGDFAMFANTSSIHTTNTLRFSHGTTFTASSSNGAPVFTFDTANALALTSSTHAFSVRNAGMKLFSVTGGGDVAVSGTVYAANASIGTPGTPGDLAERVDITPDHTVEPGDVVIVDPDRIDTYSQSQGAYEQSVAGVISTNPTIVVGNGKTSHTAVMALTGRVPIKVSSENGPISQGDLLVTASLPGYAMKYNPEQDDQGRVVGIIGMALESFEDNGTGKIMGLVRTGWMSNRNQTIAGLQNDLLTVANDQGVRLAANRAKLNVVEGPGGDIGRIDQNLNLNGYYITNVAGLFGKNNAWQIDEQGRFITKVPTADGTTPLYALQSERVEYVISGSSELQQGVAHIAFGQITQDIIDPNEAINVSVTLTQPARGVYVSKKDITGFTVEELEEGESNATFDWVVIATRRPVKAEEHNAPAVPQAPAQDPPPAPPNPEPAPDAGNVPEPQPEPEAPEQPVQENPEPQPENPAPEEPAGNQEPVVPEEAPALPPEEPVVPEPQPEVPAEVVVPVPEPLPPEPAPEPVAPPPEPAPAPEPPPPPPPEPAAPAAE